MKTRTLMAALLAVTASAYWWGRRGERGERDEPRSSDDRSMADTHRMDRVSFLPHGQPAAPSLASGAEEAAPLAPDAEPSAADDAPAAADAPAPQPSAGSTALRAHLDDSFDQQHADAAWSGSARLELERTFAALMPPTSTIKSAECRTTMCRLEMVYDSVAQYQTFMSRLSPDALPWNGTLFSTPVGDPSVGPVTFVAYLSRAGQQLAVE